MFTYTLIYDKIRLIRGDRMNNKGFTLIELLAVIVILVGISLTAVMGISASLEKRDEKECHEQIELLHHSPYQHSSCLHNLMKSFLHHIQKVVLAFPWLPCCI